MGGWAKVVECIGQQGVCGVLFCLFVVHLVPPPSPQRMPDERRQQFPGQYTPGEEGRYHWSKFSCKRIPGTPLCFPCPPNLKAFNLGFPAPFKPARKVFCFVVGVQARQRHIQIFFLSVCPWDDPWDCPRDLPGKSPPCPREQPRVSPYFTQWKPRLSQGQTQFVPGEGRQKKKMSRAYVPFRSLGVLRRHLPETY